MWHNAAVEAIVVGAIADGTTQQRIVCRLVQHGGLRLMKNHQTNGNMKVQEGKDPIDLRLLYFWGGES